MDILLKFLSEQDGTLSSTRLNALFCVLVALYMIVYSYHTGKILNTEMVYALFGYAGLIKVVSKFAEKK